MKRSLIRVLVITLLLLSVPLIAMQFSDGVDWNLFDFLIMGLLIMGFGLAIELVIKRFKKPAHQDIAIVAIVGLFLLVWAELAVGLFGTPFAGS